MATAKETELGGILQSYLIASYCYYIMDKPIMEDEAYDKLAKQLLKGWWGFRHPHKKLVTVGDLKAGTLYKLKAEDYPSIVKGAAEVAVSTKYGCSCPLLIRATGLEKGREGYVCPVCDTTYTWRRQ